MPEIPDFAASQLFLRRLAYRLVRDEAQAEDLVQDTWATWVEKRPKSVAEPRAWLARVMRNRAFNLKRTADRRGAPESLAGRPDPSAPETDGTLEAQAQLIEALRKLDEPYRSTLLQRYYHDHTAKEIAERTGTPLNTVKARLARGLERLRSAMDRRYGGDRRAWCHWLTPIAVGAPFVPPPQVSAPGGSIAAASGGSKLMWLGVLGTVAAVGGVKALWDDGGRGRETVEPTIQTVNGPRLVDEPVRERRTSVRDEDDERSDSIAVAVEKAPEGLEAPAEVDALGYVARGGAPSRPERFEWPQYAGGADHDTGFTRKDSIDTPEALWRVPRAFGQPVLSKGELYSGGIAVFRIDPASGEVLGIAPNLRGQLSEEQARVWITALVGLDHLEVLDDLESPEAYPEALQQIIVAALGAPAIGRKSVLVRYLDGSVRAHDRKLSQVLWEWREGAGTEASLPGCLAEKGVFLVPHGSELVALDENDGQVLWRFTTEDPIEAVPASADDRVFLVTERNIVALDLFNGRELWSEQHRHAGVQPRMALSFGAVLGDRLLATSSGEGAHHWKLLDVRTGLKVTGSSFDSESQASACISPGGRTFFLMGSDVSPGSRLLRDTKTGGLRPWKERVQLQIQGTPTGLPALVGTSFVYATVEGFLRVHDVETGELLWSFQAPPGHRLHDFVHSGSRVYVSTTAGLFCIGNGPNGVAIERPEPAESELLPGDEERPPREAPVVRWTGGAEAPPEK